MGLQPGSQLWITTSVLWEEPDSTSQAVAQASEAQDRLGTDCYSLVTNRSQPQQPGRWRGGLLLGLGHLGRDRSKSVTLVCPEWSLPSWLYLLPSIHCMPQPKEGTFLIEIFYTLYLIVFFSLPSPNPRASLSPYLPNVMFLLSLKQTIKDLDFKGDGQQMVDRGLGSGHGGGLASMSLDSGHQESPRCLQLFS